MLFKCVCTIVPGFVLCSSAALNFSVLIGKVGIIVETELEE